MFTRWLRFRLRKILKPIPIEYAWKKKREYSALYAFCAWNLAGLGLYTYIQTNFPMTEDEKKDHSRWFIRLLQLENVQVHRMSGFSVEKVDVVKEPGELVVEGEVVVKKNEYNPKIFTKLD